MSEIKVLAESTSYKLLVLVFSYGDKSEHEQSANDYFFIDQLSSYRRMGCGTKGKAEGSVTILSREQCIMHETSFEQTYEFIDANCVAVVIPRLGKGFETDYKKFHSTRSGMARS